MTGPLADDLAKLRPLVAYLRQQASTYDQSSDPPGYYSGVEDFHREFAVQYREQADRLDRVLDACTRGAQS